MSSLINFAWKLRRNQNNNDGDDRLDEEDHLYNHHRTFNPMHPTVLPGLQESHSSDASTVLTDWKHEDFFCIPRRHVITPEGLKPRRSFADLRDELMLGDVVEPMPNSPLKEASPEDPKKQASSNDESNNFQEMTSSAIISAEVLVTSLLPVAQEADHASNPIMWKIMPEALPLQNDVDRNQQQRYGDGAAVLPPLPTRSWSTEGAWSSPTPANSSSQNGSWPPSTGRGSWATMPTAESPNLVPGRARTAVGNLVALQQDPPGTTPLQETSRDWAYSPEERNVDAMYSPMLSRASGKKINKRTHPPLPNIVEHHRVVSGMSQIKGNKARFGDQKASESRGQPLCSSSSTAVSNQSVSTLSTLPAPSPLTRRDLLLPTTTAVVSEAVTVVPEPQDAQVVVTEKQHSHAGFNWTVTSVHGSSSGSTASKRTIKSVVFADDDALAQGIDRDLRHIKARGQQQMKEELILSALERLQDDLTLVSDVEGLLGDGSSQGMFAWFVPTPLDQEGILTGFSESTRDSITDQLDLLLTELPAQVVTPPDFPHSPAATRSKCPADDHDRVRDALSFCKVLVQMAIPESEKEESSLQGTEEIGKWRFLPGLREAIGLLPFAETPHGRGADSSFFSLPGDDNCDTPMTSNLSVGASTLTTVVNNGMSPTTPRNARGAKLRPQNGLHLRQAIQLVSTGLQKLTEACASLCTIDAQSLSKSSVADQIQQVYLQMLAMNQRDLKSIVDAFEFEFDANESYDYEVSDDEGNDSPILFAATLGFGTLADISDDRDDDSFATGPISPPRHGDFCATPGAAVDDVAPHHDDDSFERDGPRRRKVGRAEHAAAEEREAAPADDSSNRTTASSKRTTGSHYEPLERLEL